MKMIIVIVKDNEADTITQSLTSAEYRVARVASTGGFLRSGFVTLLLGVDDDRVDGAIELVRAKLKLATGNEKRATLFVIPVERYEQV